MLTDSITLLTTYQSIWGIYLGILDLLIEDLLLVEKPYYHVHDFSKNPLNSVMDTVLILSTTDTT